MGGGLLVYAKLGLKVLPDDKYCENNFNQFTSFKLMTEGNPLRFVLLYRPPSSDMDNAKKLCDMIKNAEKDTFFIGDFNIPNVDWQEMAATEARARAVLEAVEEGGLSQMVDFATHTKGNILDLVITNAPERIIGISDGGRLGKSDHCVLNIELTANPSTVNHIAKKLNWSRANLENLKDQLWQINWQEVLTSSSVEENWQSLRNSVCTIIDQNVPKSTSKPPTQPRWITREIVRFLGRKKRAWKNYKLNPTQANLGKYKTLEKEVTAKIRNAKRSLEKKLANSSNANARTFANYIKSKTKAVIGIGPLKKIEGGLATEDWEMANILNEFFASVFTTSNGGNMPVKNLETAERKHYQM